MYVEPMKIQAWDEIPSMYKMMTTMALTAFALIFLLASISQLRRAKDKRKQNYQPIN
jgi:hypothetical protein